MNTLNATVLSQRLGEPKPIIKSALNYMKNPLSVRLSDRLKKVVYRILAIKFAMNYAILEQFNTQTASNARMVKLQNKSGGQWMVKYTPFNRNLRKNGVNVEEFIRNMDFEHIINYTIAPRLIRFGVTPFIIDGKKVPEAVLGKELSLTRLVNNSYEIESFTPPEQRKLFFQIMWTCLAFEHIRFKHNDLRLGNVLFSRTGGKTYYLRYEKNVYRLNTNVEATVFDFDRSYKHASKYTAFSESIHNPLEAYEFAWQNSKKVYFCDACKVISEFYRVVNKDMLSPTLEWKEFFRKEIYNLRKWTTNKYGKDNPYWNETKQPINGFGFMIPPTDYPGGNRWLPSKLFANGLFDDFLYTGVIPKNATVYDINNLNKSPDSQVSIEKSIERSLPAGKLYQPKKLSPIGRKKPKCNGGPNTTTPKPFTPPSPFKIPVVSKKEEKRRKKTSSPTPKKPSLPKPASKPGTSKPGTSKPGTSKPGTSKPGTSKPGTSKPGTSKPPIKPKKSSEIDKLISGVAQLQIKNKYATIGHKRRKLF